jgi:16S rRNA (cytosine1402-N4)-methyltransferase
VQEITEVIRNYGEERFAFQIAKKIVAARGERPLATTGELAALVRATVRTREPGQDAATRTFQALRIHINQELEQLALVLPQAMTVLEKGRAPGGDQFPLARRPPRQALHARRGGSGPLAEKACPCAPPSCRSRGFVCSASRLRASAAEVAANPRARSAVMRVAEKLPERPPEMVRLNVFLLLAAGDLQPRRGDFTAQGTQDFSGT